MIAVIFWAVVLPAIAVLAALAALIVKAVCEWLTDKRTADNAEEQR